MTTYELSVTVMTKNAGAHLDAEERAGDFRALLLDIVDDHLRNVRHLSYVLDLEVTW